MRLPVEVRALLMGAAALVLYHAAGGELYGAILAVVFLAVYVALLSLERLVRR